MITKTKGRGGYIYKLKSMPKQPEYEWKEWCQIGTYKTIISQYILGETLYREKKPF